MHWREISIAYAALLYATVAQIPAVLTRGLKNEDKDKVLTLPNVSSSDGYIAVL
jgi:hypothetical protein